MQERKPYVTTKHFKVDIFDREGKKITQEEDRIYSVEYTEYQDTVDLLPYFFENGKLYVVVIESCKPALLLRPSVIKQIEDCPDPETNGYILEQPSAVIQNRKNEYSIYDTIVRILKEKLPGLVLSSSPTILGGSYFPSVGSSTEIVFPRAVAINPDTTYSFTSVFSKAYVMEAQEVIDCYLQQQKIVSTRLIELVFRLADKYTYKISLGVEMTIPQTYSKDQVFHRDRFMGKEELRSLIEADVPEGSAVSSVSLTEVEKPKNPFLLTTHFRAEAVSLTGEKEQKEVDVLIRKNIDSIDVGGYFIVDEMVYMPIKWGIRPALAVRNLMPHPIHTDVSMYFIEGVSGSCEGEKSKKDLLTRASLETEEEVSLALAQDSLYIGYDYPSPGHNPERVYRAILPLDPTQEVIRKQHEEETTRIAYVSIEDIISLSHEGIIRDPRLSLNAHILACLYNNTKYQIRKIELQNKDHIFEEIVNRPSEVQQWLSKVSPQVDSILSESSLYRKLKTYGENELGVAVMKLTHDKEAHFFSPMVPLFAMPSSDKQDKLPFYYLHDLFHYATTGFIPLVKEHGKVNICSFEDYLQANAGNECEAVWYSDVLIPEEFGVDKAEQIFNGDSVARAFSELSIDKEEARTIIREIELTGTIRDEVKNHPLFGRYKSVFVGRLLRYHVMDMDNCKSMYEYWSSNLDIAETMQDFCDVFVTVQAYEAYYQKTINLISTYTEGVNPLRAYLSKLLNVGFRLTALKLAYVRHEARKYDLKEVMEHTSLLLVKLKEAYIVVRAKREMLTNIDPTEKNKTIISEAHAFEHGVLRESELYLESLSTQNNIPEDVRNAIKERVVPFFEPFRDIDPEFLKNEMKHLEERNNLA